MFLTYLKKKSELASGLYQNGCHDKQMFIFPFDNFMLFEL